MRVHNQPIFYILLVGGALIYIVLLNVVTEVVMRLVTERRVQGATAPATPRRGGLKDTQNGFY